MKGNSIEKHSYMPGLDGLRALAVFAVIGFHLNLPFVPGGFLGVTLFFVLSGYLITDILLSEWKNDEKIDLKSFYIRRAKRLLPSILFLLICMAAYITVFRADLLPSFKSDVLPALFFFSNWWYIFQKVPYFTTFTNPALLNHFWSLAVEVQFYFIWPVLLFIGQRFIRRKWLSLAVTAVIAILSAFLMAVLFKPGADTSRIYYGTDTRVFSLLLGACLAYALPSTKLATAAHKKTTRAVLDVTGLIALLAVLFMSYYITQYDDFLYLGGMFLFSAASMLLIAASTNPLTVIGKVFSFKPLRFIGKISYGVYLWQFPVIVISNTMFPSNRLNIVLCVSQVAVTLLMATVSYYLIEKPIRQKKIIESLQKNTFRDFCRSCLNLRWRVKSTALLVLVLVLVSCVGLLGARAVPNMPTEVLSALPSQINSEPASNTNASAVQSASPSPVLQTNSQCSDQPTVSSSPPPISDSPTQSAVSSSPSISENPSVPVSPSASTDPSDSPASASPTTDDPATEITPSDLRVTVVGDSVALDFAPYLRKYYPKMNIDAEEGRQFYQAKTIIKQLIQKKELGSTVVIELGSNGSFSESSMRSLIDLIGSDRKIVFVNAQVPRSWCATVNDMLTKVCAEYANTVIADWYNVSTDRSEYFYKDGFHPNTTGSPVLAKVIADAIEIIQDPL